jgi:hypothetical protein
VPDSRGLDPAIHAARKTRFFNVLLDGRAMTMAGVSPPQPLFLGSMVDRR